MPYKRYYEIVDNKSAEEVNDATTNRESNLARSTREAYGPVPAEEIYAWGKNIERNLHNL